MGKKDKPGRPPPTEGGAALKHNPFAALAALGAALSTQPENAPRTAAASNAAQREAPPTPAAGSTKERAVPSGKLRGRLVLRRETKHRGGKAVIVVSGFAALKDFGTDAVEQLAKQLKQQLGCGGTVEQQGDAHEIVLQGDRAKQVAEALRARGFRVDGVTS